MYGRKQQQRKVKRASEDTITSAKQKKKTRWEVGDTGASSKGERLGGGLRWPSKCASSRPICRNSRKQREKEMPDQRKSLRTCWEKESVGARGKKRDQDQCTRSKQTGEKCPLQCSS